MQMLLQALWDQVVLVVGTDPFTYLFLGTTVVTIQKHFQSNYIEKYKVSTIVYWGVGCLFFFCDITLKPEVRRLDSESISKQCYVLLKLLVVSRDHKL